MKVRDLIRQIEAAGWTLERTRGSHRQYTHPDRPGAVTIPGHLNEDLQAGTLASILKQAGMRRTPPQRRPNR